MLLATCATGHLPAVPQHSPPNTGLRSGTPCKARPPSSSQFKHAPTRPRPPQPRGGGRGRPRSRPRRPGPAQTPASARRKRRRGRGVTAGARLAPRKAGLGRAGPGGVTPGPGRRPRRSRGRTCRGRPWRRSGCRAGRAGAAGRPRRCPPPPAATAPAPPAPARVRSARGSGVEGWGSLDYGVRGDEEVRGSGDWQRLRGSGWRRAVARGHWIHGCQRSGPGPAAPMWIGGRGVVSGGRGRGG